MRVWTVFLVTILFFFSGLSFGTEIDSSKSRNPFEFGGSKKHGAGSKTKGNSDSDESKRKVGMIMIIKNRKIAIIDGKRYKVGDSIDEYLIKSITLDYVELVTDKSAKKIYVNEIIE